MKTIVSESRAALREYNVVKGEAAIEGYSPVSYVEKGLAEKGKSKYAVKHRGITYYLTSADQVQKFNADPDKYVPAYGGWCAYGCAIGKKFPVDPETFKIVNGRLLLFLKDDKVDARRLWNQGIELEQTEKADDFWHSLTGE